MGAVMCPYLKGSRDGAVCNLIHNFIRNMEGFTIKLCMNRHYEACSVYIGTLQRIIGEKQCSLHQQQ